MIPCIYCQEKFVAITAKHLKKHRKTLKNYKGLRVAQKDCEDCGKLIKNRKTPKKILCNKCGKIRTKNNVLKAVRKHTKKIANQWLFYSNLANEEWRMHPHLGYSFGKARVDRYHDSWDTMPIGKRLGMNKKEEYKLLQILKEK